MMPQKRCLLCKTPTKLFLQEQDREYRRCNGCGAIFMDPKDYLSLQQEKKRYQLHENEINDLDYQAFVEPVVEAVKQDHGTNARGLDYGAGEGPVATHLLRKSGRDMKIYDPFFAQKPEALEGTYDFIICIEVAEHFHAPAREFKRLYDLLRMGGHLYCMTLRFSEAIDFKQWYYRNDQTHVIFYQDDTVRWIKREFGFRSLRLQDRLFVLQK